MEDIQNQLTDKLLLSDFDKFPVGLFHGKMGLVIYFYHLSKIESNPEYQAMADRLRDQIRLNDLFFLPQRTQRTHKVHKKNTKQPS